MISRTSSRTNVDRTNRMENSSSQPTSSSDNNRSVARARSYTNQKNNSFLNCLKLRKNNQKNFTKEV